MSAQEKTMEKTDSATGQTAQAGTRVSLLPAVDLHTVYANSFQVSFARDEVLLTACVSRQEQDQQGHLLTLQQQAQLAMSPASARRLAQVLIQTLQQYDQQFGQQAGQQTGPSA